MGRSVSYLSYATQVAYIETPTLFDDEGLELENYDYYDWDDFVEDVFNVLQEKFPTLDEANRWDCRETRIFAENGLAEFGISEYFGLVSISVRPKDDAPNFAKSWTEKINLTGLIKSKFDKVYSKDGSLSNGEAIYSKV